MQLLLINVYQNHIRTTQNILFLVLQEILVTYLALSKESYKMYVILKSIKSPYLRIVWKALQ